MTFTLCYIIIIITVLLLSLVSVPVVVKFSLPKLMAPLESVIDPLASVRLPTVDPDGRPALVLAVKVLNVPAAAVLAPIMTLSMLDVPVPSMLIAPLAVKPVVVVVPFTCNSDVGSEVPIPTRELVTSK